VIDDLTFDMATIYLIEHSSDIDSARMVIGLDQGKAGKP
jgi:hypothetical protein